MLVPPCLHPPLQLLSIAGGFMASLLWDFANGKIKEREVGVRREKRGGECSVWSSGLTSLCEGLAFWDGTSTELCVMQLVQPADRGRNSSSSSAHALVFQQTGGPCH